MAVVTVVAVVGEGKEAGGGAAGLRALQPRAARIRLTLGYRACFVALFVTRRPFRFPPRGDAFVEFEKR